MSIDFQKGVLSFSGGDGLDRALKELDEKVQRRLSRRAVRKAAEPVLQKAKAAAPVLTGTLCDSLVIKTKAGDGSISARVVADDRLHMKAQGKKATGRELFYGLFAEFGTSRQPARPFMRPAFDSQRESSVSTIKGELQAGIEREARKLARKQAAAARAKAKAKS